MLAFPPDLPHDVVCALVESFDFETLKTASPVDRDFKHMADKLIWRAFRIEVTDYRRGAEAACGLLDVDEVVREGCRVARAGDRPLRIRSFTVKLGGMGEEIPSEAALEMIFDTLRVLTKLRELELQFDVTGCQQALERVVVVQKPFSFQLDRLALLFFSPPDMWGCMHDFILSQNRITRLYLGNDLMPLPESALPHLSHLRIHDPRMTTIVANRPVTHVYESNYIRRAIDVVDIVTNVGKSTGPIRYLEFTCDDLILLSWAFKRIAADLPSIRCLSVGCPDMYDDGRIFKLLATLSELEEIICVACGGWEVTSDNEDRFLEPISTIVPLRKVTFLRRHMSFVALRCYTRKTFGGVWDVDVQTRPSDLMPRIHQTHWQPLAGGPIHG